MPALAIVLIVVAVLLLAGAGLVAGSRSARRRGSARSLTARPGAVEAAPAESSFAPEVGEQAGAAGIAAAPAPPGAATLEAAPGAPALRERLGRARALIGGYLDGIRGRGVDDATLEQLEEALILADVGITTTTRVLDDLRSQVRSGEIERTPEALLAALRAGLEALFEGDSPDLRHGEGEGPTVWLFVGVNGVGKTTTIGKVAARERAAGERVVMAAGDTFRAAAGEQLETWAERASATIIRGSEGADPSSVIFDAVQHAAARGASLVLADTAGRLHTKVNLMEELRKVRRVAERPPGQLTEVLLVIDATTGQNGLVQARQFTEAVGVTGIVLTKLDGTAKGGVVLAIRSELGLPIKLVGVGESVEDLVEFDAKEFVDALFA
ncbi:MAG TPA: signal recognition particle-docking protein FtsY [Acidimicrobiales bacterium]|nr:signal recognition particle-docking protein FtsY [Acidimicrobiales bacterium]